MKNGCLTIEFEARIDEFINFALSHPELMDRNRIRRPCDQRKYQKS